MAFPLCSSFVPTILEGQLCYKLDLKELSGEGKRNELLLLLDYNEERSLQTSFKTANAYTNVFLTNIKNKMKMSKEIINLDTTDKALQDVSAKVQINTLSPYVHFGGGIFLMTLVKKMTAKSDFLQMTLEERGCNVDLYEDCRTKMLVKECNCVPWELLSFQV